MSSEISYEDVSLEIGGRALLANVQMTIAAGESVALIGRSGAGKTTALRMINGLAVPSSGRVTIDGVDMTSTDLVALRRRTGYVLQSVGLFPHRSVFDNIATVPRLQGWEPDEIEERARELLEAVALPWSRYHDRFPHTLSGGEKQRVGIVRALIAGPDILLCDEPFGALDPIVRRELQQIVISLRRRFNTTVVFVSHDLQEAMTIGDRIALFDEGSIVAIAPPSEFFSQRHPLVVQFAEAGLAGEGV